MSCLPRLPDPAPHSFLLRGGSGKAGDPGKGAPRRIFFLLCLSFLLQACAGPPAEGLSRLPAAPAGSATGRPSSRGGTRVEKGWVDPEVLSIPRKGDAPLFVCGGKKFFKHQAYDLLMEQDPRRGLQLLHAMANLALAAEVARHEGVRVPLSEVDRLVEMGMKKDRARARRNFGPKATLADFAALELGMSLREYKDWLKRMASRQLLLSYTVVFTALREDRVQCRFMALPTRKEALRLARSVREGADFQTLARKYSLDPTAVQGGRIPPFSRDFEHPVAQAAFSLKEGQVSDPIPGRQGDRRVWYLVFLEKRIPGKKGTFRDLEEEIRRRVRESPPSPEDFLAFFGAARRRYGLRLFPGGNTRGAHERGTGSLLERRGVPAEGGDPGPGGGGDPRFAGKRKPSPPGGRGPSSPSPFPFRGRGS